MVSLWSAMRIVESILITRALAFSDARATCNPSHRSVVQSSGATDNPPYDPATLGSFYQDTSRALCVHDMCFYISINTLQVFVSRVQIPAVPLVASTPGNAGFQKMDGTALTRKAERTGMPVIPVPGKLDTGSQGA